MKSAERAAEAMTCGSLRNEEPSTRLLRRQLLDDRVVLISSLEMGTSKTGDGGR